MPDDAALSGTAWDVAAAPSSSSSTASPGAASGRLPGTQAGLRQWRYTYGNVDFPIRSVPHIGGPKTGAFLRPGDIFHVKREEPGRDGVLYLELANGAGWVFDRIPSFPPLCYPHTGDEDVFDIDDACAQVLAHMRVQPRRDPLTINEWQGILRGDSTFNCAPCGGSSGGGIPLQLSVEAITIPQQHLTSKDVFDVTFTPRSFELDPGASVRQAAATPGQRRVSQRVELPELEEYPQLPGLSPLATKDEKRKQLLGVYQEFAVDLHTGMFLTQLTANHDYTDIHCQLVEDMTSLRLDQSTGRIVEFPLTDVSRIYLVSVPMPSSREQIVVVEFVRRKLAFVFKEKEVAQRFQICMELLVQQAQRKQGTLAGAPTVLCEHASAPEHRQQRVANVMQRLTPMRSAPAAPSNSRPAPPNFLSAADFRLVPTGAAAATASSPGRAPACQQQLFREGAQPIREATPMVEI